MPDHYEYDDIRFNRDRNPPRWETLTVKRFWGTNQPIPETDDWVPLDPELEAALVPYDDVQKTASGRLEFHLAGGGPNGWVSEESIGTQDVNQSINDLAWEYLGINKPSWWPADVVPPLKNEIIGQDPDTGRTIRGDVFDSAEYQRFLNLFGPRGAEGYPTEQVFGGQQAVAYGAQPGGQAIVTFNPDGTVGNVQLISPPPQRDAGSIADQIAAAVAGGDYSSAAELRAIQQTLYAEPPRDVTPNTYTAPNGQQFLVSASGAVTPLEDPALERHRLQLEEIQSGYQTEIARHQANSKRSTDNLLFDLLVAGDFEKAERVQRVLNPIDPLRVLSVMSDFADNPEALRRIFDYLDNFGRSDEVPQQARQMVDPSRPDPSRPGTSRPEPPRPTSESVLQEVVDPGFSARNLGPEESALTGPPSFGIGVQSPEQAVQDALVPTFVPGGEQYGVDDFEQPTSLPQIPQGPGFGSATATYLYGQDPGSKNGIVQLYVDGVYTPVFADQASDTIKHLLAGGHSVFEPVPGQGFTQLTNYPGTGNPVSTLFHGDEGVQQVLDSRRPPPTFDQPTQLAAPTFDAGAARDQQFNTFQQLAQSLKIPEPPVTFSGRRAPFGTPTFAR